ncbi:MAG TPA: hypothetical protein VF267_12405 [Gammaproteobacteria bacterium]
MHMNSLRSCGALLLMLLPSFFGANAMAAEPDQYRLTEKALGQYESATEAMYEYMIAHPERVEVMESAGDPSMAEPEDLARFYDEHLPGLREAMEASGMSLKDYYVFTFTIVGNAFGLAMAEQFGGADDAELTETQRANLAFVRKYGKRFEAFGERMNQKYGNLDTE